MDPASGFIDRVLGRLAMRATGAVVHTASFTARRVAERRGTLSDLSIQTDVAYGALPEQRLDVVRLCDLPAGAPVLLYLHGGGFQQLSRRTHWWFAVQFARAGYLVFSADYRLAPAHPYPAAVEDARLAFTYAVREAARWHGDGSRIVVAGESAGANLALGLAIAANPIKPRGAVLFAGLLQVSEPQRLFTQQKMPRVLRARIASITHDYAKGDSGPAHACDPYLDPLLWLEQQPALAHALPPVYASVGTRDPVLSDTRRLERALANAQVKHHVEVYDGEPHAFQGMPFRAAARSSWKSCFSFLKEAALDSSA